VAELVEAVHRCRRTDRGVDRQRRREHVCAAARLNLRVRQGEKKGIIQLRITPLPGPVHVMLTDAS
jgi:hypothetical protein